MEDVKISGKGDLNGGQYQSVTISGMGKCTGNMRAQDITVSGTFKCEGSIECGAATVNGTLKCEGPLSAEKMTCNGLSNIQGDMVANTLAVGGMLHVYGTRLAGAEINAAGTITVDGQVCVEKLRVTGIIKATELSGGEITIRSNHHGLLRQFINLSSTAELIQADILDLAGVTANTVRGKDVTIGPACTIENLDCSGTLYIDPTSMVSNLTGDYTVRG